MKVKDYFKVSFRKPEISESISELIKRKNDLKSQLESCYSRLESIEICNSNAKPSDALILSNYLIVDILNLALLFIKQSPIEISDHWKEKIKLISDSELLSLFTSHQKLVESSNENSEEKAESFEVSLSDLLDAVEKHIFKKNKSLFENPVDDYKRKTFVQVSVSIILIALIVNLGVKQYNKIKPIKDDVAKIYFINSENPTPSDLNSVLAKVKPTLEWVDVSFVLPSPVEIKDIKIEPIHQTLSRFQIRDVKYLDSDKKILYERNFKLNKLGMPDNSETNEICCMEEMKPGRLIPDHFIELESTNTSPSFYIKAEAVKDVKEIILGLRYIKNNKRFND